MFDSSVNMQDSIIPRKSIHSPEYKTSPMIKKINVALNDYTKGVHNLSPKRSPYSGGKKNNTQGK